MCDCVLPLSFRLVIVARFFVATQSDSNKACAKLAISVCAGLLAILTMLFSYSGEPGYAGVAFKGNNQGEQDLQTYLFLLNQSQANQTQETPKNNPPPPQPPTSPPPRGED